MHEWWCLDTRGERWCSVRTRCKHVIKSLNTFLCLLKMVKNFDWKMKVVDRTGIWLGNSFSQENGFLLYGASEQDKKLFHFLCCLCVLEIKFFF